MMKRERYHSPTSLGKRALMLLLSIAMVLTMMPMVPGYVGEASAAAADPVIKGIDIYQGGSSAAGTKVYSYNPATNGWTNAAGVAVAKPELIAGSEYYVKPTIEKVNAADDAWVSVTVPNGIVFKNVPGGTKVGKIDYTYFDELLAWNDLAAFAADYNPIDGTLKWHIKDSHKTISPEFSIRADANNYDFTPSGMTISNALKVETGLTSGTTSNVATMNALETMPSGGASELDFRNSDMNAVAMPGQETSLELGLIYMKGMYPSQPQDSVSTVPLARSIEADITYPTGATLSKVSAYTWAAHPPQATLSTPTNNGDGTSTVRATLNYDGSNWWCFSQTWYAYFVWPASMAGTTQTVRFNNVQWTSKQTGRSVTMAADKTRVLKVALGSNTEEVLATVPVASNMYNYAIDGKTDMNYPLTQFLLGNTGVASAPKNVTIEYDPDKQATIRMITLPSSLAAGTVVDFTLTDGKTGKYTIPASQQSAGTEPNKSWVIKNTDLRAGTAAGISTISFSGWVIPQGFESNLGVKNGRDVYIYAHFPFQAYGTFNAAGATAIESTMTITSAGKPTTTCTSTCMPVSKAVYHGNIYGPVDINNGQPKQVTVGSGVTIKGSISLNNAIHLYSGVSLATTTVLADPVLYALMPAGFSYSDLRVMQDGAEIPYEIIAVNSPKAAAAGLTVTKIAFTQDVRTGYYRSDGTNGPISISTKINVDNSVQIGSYDVDQFFLVAVGDGHNVELGAWSGVSSYYDDYSINEGRRMIGAFKGTIAVNENKTVQITNSMKDSGGNWITYNGTDATTGFVKAGSVTQYKVNIKNKTGKNIAARECKVYIPIPKTGQDLGDVFNPTNAAFGFDISKAALVGNVPAGWEIKYYKVAGKVDATGVDPGTLFTGMTETIATDTAANMIVLSNINAMPDAQATGGQVNGQDFIFNLTTASSVVSGKKNIMNCAPVYTIDGNVIAPAGSPIAMEVAGGIVTGYVYNDGNRNGKKDSGETGIAGVTVTVRDSSNHVSQVKTDSNGKYEVTGLRDGSGVKTSVQIANSNVSALTFFAPPATAVTANNTYPSNVTASANQAYASKTDINLNGLTNHTAYVNAAMCTPITLMFNPNGGALNNAAQATINGALGGYIKLPTLKERAGYTCNGWYTATSGGTKIGDQGGNFRVPKDPATYFARWTKLTYKITYTLNGGTAASGAPATYTVEDAVTLKNPTKTGYTFKGWTGSNGSTPQTNVTIPKGSTGNKNYTANWTANSYTIKFDSNGGSGTMSNLAMTYGTAKTLPANTFTKAGCTFTGWNSVANGSGTAFTDKQSVNNLRSTPNGTITLYAQWDQKDITIVPIPEQIYTAKAIEPPVTVKIDGKELIAGQDYDVVYKDNTLPGTATVTVTCKNGYTGTKTAEFTIKNTFKSKGQWVSKHENTYVTFNWTGTPNNSLATGWDVQYRTKLIGTQYAWTKWTSVHEDGKILSKRLYLKPNHTIEFKVKHETEASYLRSVFTTPAGGKYQSITQCRVKVIATASGAAYRQGTKTLALKTGTNFSGDTGNIIYVKKGTAIKITPNHVYPRSNFSKYPRLYPNHAWYDVANKSVVSLSGMNSTAGMMDSAITIRGLKAGTTTIKITSCNGRGATLTIVVK